MCSGSPTNFRDKFQLISWTEIRSSEMECVESPLFNSPVHSLLIVSLIGPCKFTFPGLTDKIKCGTNPKIDPRLIVAARCHCQTDYVELERLPQLVTDN